VLARLHRELTGRGDPTLAQAKRVLVELRDALVAIDGADPAEAQLGEVRVERLRGVR
jgi:hypothetical protein